MLLHQLRQIAIHHLTRPSLIAWASTALLAVIAIGSLINAARSSDASPLNAVFPMLALSIFPFQALLNHAIVSQFSNPQAALVPGYRKPHLLFLLLSAIVFQLAGVLLVAATASVSPWSLFAASGLINAAFLFPASSTLFFPLLMLFQFEVFEGASGSTIAAAWLHAEGWRFPAIVAATLVSWILIAVHAIDASSGREEGTLLPRFLLKQTNWRLEDTAQEKERGHTNRPTWLQRIWNSSRLDRQIRRMRSSGTLQKMRVGISRTSSDSPGASVRLFSVLAAVGLIRIWRSTSSFTLNEASWEQLASMLPFLTLAAGLAPGVTIAGRIPQMSFERLLPMSNQTFADALVFNALRSSFLWWLAAHAAALAAMQFLPWEYIDRPSQATVATYAFISFASLLFACGAAAVGALSPGFIAAILVGAPSVAVCIGIPGYWSSMRPGEPSGGVIAFAAICAMIGVYMITLARTSWRDREFG